ncbi:PaaI family thioesterase [Acidianus sp. RZ1]|uniref:PaaI family thioesterase n=1 Tax=Acidianus sp. RZ1 TaxID=1540082 RepID=UPI001490B30D|nr:PaaI family thioesterase [Acidianus sp. RZ1]NON61290.1 PaaI family thioesterase [Acidianus sp. RZ1]
MLELQKNLENDPVFSYLGGELLLLEKGLSKIRIPYKPELCRRGNVLNGGMIMTAMDFAGGLATLSVNDGIDQVTQELKVNFLEPMYKGPFEVTAKVIRKGRTAVVVEIDFVDSEGKLGAKGIGTWYIIRDKKVMKE